MFAGDEAAFARAYRDLIQASMKEFPHKDPVKVANAAWSRTTPLRGIANKEVALAHLDEILQLIPPKFRQTAVDVLNRHQSFSEAIGANGPLDGEYAVPSLKTLTKEATQKAAKANAKKRSRSSTSLPKLPSATVLPRL